MLGLAAHPNFKENPYIYVTYAYDVRGDLNNVCVGVESCGPVDGRLVRFKVGADNLPDG
jgi:hypothetical protein